MTNVNVDVKEDVNLEVVGEKIVPEEIVYDGVSFKLITHPLAEEGVYYISKDARIYSTKRDRILKPQNAVGDYQHMMLLRSDTGVYKSKVYVHHLVAHTYLGERPVMYNEQGVQVMVVIHHKDDDMYNNHLSNLEYVTHQTNVQLGRASKLNKEVVKLIREASSKGEIDYELIGNLLDVKPATLKLVVSGRTWNNV